MSEGPGGADALGPAVGGTGHKSRRGIVADAKVQTKVDRVSVGYGDAPSACKGAGGVGLALRLGIGDLWSKEPLNFGFAVADAAAAFDDAGELLNYGAVPITVDSDLLWAI